jgi:hypothetical protein
MTCPARAVLPLVPAPAPPPQSELPGRHVQLTTLEWRGVSCSYRRSTATTDPRAGTIRTSSPLNEGVSRKGGKAGEVHILRGVYGRAEAGELTALLGPSGAGKSSLLEALWGKRPARCHMEGVVLVNGQPAGAGSNLKRGLAVGMATDQTDQQLQASGVVETGDVNSGATAAGGNSSVCYIPQQVRPWLQTNCCAVGSAWMPVSKRAKTNMKDLHLPALL